MNNEKHLIMVLMVIVLSAVGCIDNEKSTPEQVSEKFVSDDEKLINLINSLDYIDRYAFGAKQAYAKAHFDEAEEYGKSIRDESRRQQIEAGTLKVSKEYQRVLEEYMDTLEDLYSAGENIENGHISDGKADKYLRDAAFHARSIPALLPKE